MNDGYLNKDFFRKMALYLLLRPIREHDFYNPPPLQMKPSDVQVYKVCLAKWDAIVKLAEKNPQSYFNDWTYRYVDKDLDFDERRMKTYWGYTKEELRTLMVVNLLEFEETTRSFNGLVWDYAPYGNPL